MSKLILVEFLDVECPEVAGVVWIKISIWEAVTVHILVVDAGIERQVVCGRPT